MSANYWNWLKTAAKFSFAFIILGYMVATDRLNLAVVKEGFSRWEVVLGCLGLIGFSSVLSFYRWKLLLRGLGLEFPFREILRYGLIGAFFNTTMPGAVSGDLIKAWYILSDYKGQEKTPILASILLDRVVGVFGLVIVSMVALLTQWENAWSQPALKAVAYLVLMLGAGVLGFFLYLAVAPYGPFAYIRRKLEPLRAKRAGEILLKAYDSWISYRNRPGIMLAALSLAITTHICVVSSAIVCAKALGVMSMHLYQYYLLVPMGLLTTAIPVAPAGLGVGHVAFGKLFAIGGSNHGAEIFTLFITVQILINLTGIFYYLRSKKPAQPIESVV